MRNNGREMDAASDHLKSWAAGFLDGEGYL